jgi:hypothetical protein
MTKVRINVCNPLELQKLTTLDHRDIEAILRHRAEHGPIGDARELGRILGPESITPSLIEQVDFAPADDTAPEAPGA